MRSVHFLPCPGGTQRRTLSSCKEAGGRMVSPGHFRYRVGHSPGRHWRRSSGMGGRLTAGAGGFSQSLETSRMICHAPPSVAFNRVAYWDKRQSNLRPPLSCQPPEDFKKRIASFPPDEQVYELWR